MGFLLKFILLGIAAYTAWKTFARWKGMFDRLVGKPDRPAAPPPPAPTGAVPSHRTAVVEDTVQCAGCGSYGLASAAQCSQCGRPLPQGRN
jgi:hypothetical protein